MGVVVEFPRNLPEVVEIKEIIAGARDVATFQKRSQARKKYKNKYGKPLKSYKGSPIKVKVPSIVAKSGMCTERRPKKNWHSLKPTVNC